VDEDINQAKAQSVAIDQDEDADIRLCLDADDIQDGTYD
jgi:hypothetical protein